MFTVITATFLLLFVQVSSECALVDWRTHRKRVEALNLVGESLAQSALVQHVSQKLHPLDLTTGVHGTTLTNFLGLHYMIDILKLRVLLDGFHTIKLSDFKVKGKHEIEFDLSVGKLEGSVLFNADYERKSWHMFNSSYCFFSTEAWDQPCPHREYFVNTSFALTDFKAKIHLTVALYKCSGGFFDRSYCKMRSVWSYFTSLFLFTTFDQLLGRVNKVKIENIKNLAFKSIDYDLEAFSLVGHDEAEEPEIYKSSRHFEKSKLNAYSYEVVLAMLVEGFLDVANMSLANLFRIHGKKKPYCYGRPGRKQKPPTSP